MHCWVVRISWHGILYKNYIVIDLGMSHLPLIVEHPWMELLLNFQLSFYFVYLLGKLA